MNGIYCRGRFQTCPYTAWETWLLLGIFRKPNGYEITFHKFALIPRMHVIHALSKEHRMMINGLILKRFTVGSFPVNGYLVADPVTRVGAFIDPGGFSKEIDAFVREQKILLQYLFVTHGYWDHTEGLADFTSRYQVQSYAGEGEIHAVSYSLRGGGEVIEVGHLRFHVLLTPGHTPCGISYSVPGCVFTGDALFCGTVGSAGSLKEAKRQIDHIRRHIFSLPDEMMVFPAHGPMTTVGIKKYANPFFR